MVQLARSYRALNVQGPRHDLRMYTFVYNVCVCVCLFAYSVDIYIYVYVCFTVYMYLFMRELGPSFP